MVMDYKERKIKYNNIIKGLNQDLEGLVGRLKDDIKTQNKILNPVTAELPPSCGSIEKNPFVEGEDLTPEDLQDIRQAEEDITEIITEISDNEIKFPEGGSILPPSPPGEEGGGEVGYIALPESEGGEPEWFSAIEAGLGELIGMPEIGRKNLDYEGAQTYISQGVAVFRKLKSKVIDKNKEVYVLMDQSGSMSQYAFEGISFLDLLAQFVPELGKKYTGEFWVCDGCGMNKYDEKARIPNDKVPLQDVDKRLIYHGGGGTAFGGAFRKLGNIEKYKQQENPEYEMCVIFFSDMDIMDYEFKQYKQYGPTKQIWVTSTGKKEQLLRDAPWIRADENIQEVYINMEKTK